MKKLTVFSLVLLMLTTFSSFSYAATDYTDSYYDRATYKLGRGFSNVFLSPFEVIRSIDDHVDNYGIGGGIPIGFFHGFGRMVARIGTGIFEAITFFIDPDPSYRLMEPEFAFSFQT